MSKIILSSINKTYSIPNRESFQALKDINLELEENSLVVIKGESGSGKSTLMNLLGGLDTDYSGDIKINGDNIQNFNEKEMSRFHKETVGFVFQNSYLIPHLTILDNVTLAMTLSNQRKKDRIRRAKEILKSVGLESQIKKKPNQLSGGQKQRVAIARALVNNPDIIIADEPTGAVDSKTSKQILKIFRRIADSGKLVLVVTHSEKVARLSDRVITIADGKIVSDINQVQKGITVEDGPKEEINFLSESLHRGKLSLFSALRLSLTNMQEKIGRNILIALGGSIGIMSIILMLGLGQGVNDYLTNTMTSTVNPLVSEVRMPMEEEPTSTNPELEDNSENLPEGPPQRVGPASMDYPSFEKENIEELSRIEGVVDTVQGYSAFTMGGSELNFKGKTVPFMQINTMSPMITASNVIEGESPGEYEILITSELKRRFEEIMEENEDLTVNVVYLVSKTAQNSEIIQEKVKEMGYAGSPMASLVETFTEMIDIFTYIMIGVAALSLIISAIMILTVMHISVIERTQEIGLIKSIGGRRKDIRRIFVTESILIGIFTGLVALGVAYGLGVLGNKLSQHLYEINIFHITETQLMLGMSISIIVSFLSGLMPANSASKLDPVEALRTESSR